MTFLILFWRALRLWLVKEADQYAAALSYFVPFALTPLVLISMTWVGVMVGTERIVDLLVYWGDTIDPELPVLMADALAQLDILTQSFTVPIIGVIFFSVMVVVAINSLTAGIHKLWSIEQYGWKSTAYRYLRALLVVVLLQFYFVFLIISSGVITWFDIILDETIVSMLRSLVFLIATVLLITLIFRVLPLATLPVRSCVYGGMVTGVLFVGLKSFVAFHLVTAPAVTFYGAASIIVVMLIWFYTVAAAVLFGAAYAKVHADWTTTT
jgi:membrane protein